MGVRALLTTPSIVYLPTRFIKPTICGIVILFTFLFGMYIGQLKPDDTKLTHNISLPEYQFKIRYIKEGTDMFKEDNWEYTDFKSEVECLAHNMFFEARDQSRQGIIAVALVTINRVKSDRFPNSICEVVWQKRRSKKTGKMVAQFSWTLDDMSNDPKDYTQEQETLDFIHSIADTMLSEQTLSNFYDFTKGANHYHTVYIKPVWIDDLFFIKRIDEHLMYKDN